MRYVKEAEGLLFLHGTGYTEMQKVILLLNQENFNLQPFPCGLAEDWSKGNNTFQNRMSWSDL